MSIEAVSNPFFSIILPTYNREKIVKSTIQSILSQEFKDFELIIVDDGSTDNTKSVILALSSIDNRIKYFYKKNEERNIARNYGAARSTGQYLIFFDSDDIMKPSFLETYYGYLNKKEIPILTSNIDFNGKLINVYENFKKRDITMTLCGPGHIYLPCTAFRKDTVDMPFFFPDPLFIRGEDLYRILLSSKTYNVKIIPYCGTEVGEHLGRSVYQDNLDVQKYSYTLMKKLLKDELNSSEFKVLSSELDLTIAFRLRFSDKIKSIRHMLDAIVTNSGLLGDKRVYVLLRDVLFF